MAGHESLQPGAPAVEQRRRAHDGADQAIPLGRWPAARPIPAVVRDVELMAILGQSRTRFYLRKKHGDFAFLELRPQLRDSGTLYSGELVARWIAGDLKLRKPGPMQLVAKGAR